MSAWVDRVRLYQAACDECHWSGALTPSEDDDDSHAEAHDAVHHDPHDTLDDA